MSTAFFPWGSSTRRFADRFGTWTSVLCAIHCLLTPVLLGLSAGFAHWLPTEESTHRRLSLLVTLFGIVALLQGFRKHQKRAVLLFMVMGLGCILGTAWLGELLPSHGVEVAITLLGSALMIAAHRLNHTFCRHCECAKAGRLCTTDNVEEQS